MMKFFSSTTSSTRQHEGDPNGDEWLLRVIHQNIVKDIHLEVLEDSYAVITENTNIFLYKKRESISVKKNIVIWG